MPSNGTFLQSITALARPLQKLVVKLMPWLQFGDCSLEENIVAAEHQHRDLYLLRG